MSPEAPKPSPEIIKSVPGISTPEAEAPVMPEITNFAEAKAFKRWQDSQAPESQAAADAMREERARRDAEQIAQLEEQAKQLAENPNAITGIPEDLK